MILFHGSNVVVKVPMLVAQNRFLDFGNGFYTTTNQAQAESFATKVSKRRGGTPFVSQYTFDETSMQNSLSVKRFLSPDTDWLDFVTANRTGTYAGQQFDIIIEAVANDDVYRTIQVYLSGILSKEQTLESLKIKKLFDQYVFATNKALAELHFVQAWEV